MHSARVLQATERQYRASRFRGGPATRKSHSIEILERHAYVATALGRRSTLTVDKSLSSEERTSIASSAGVTPAPSSSSFELERSAVLGTALAALLLRTALGAGFSSGSFLFVARSKIPRMARGNGSSCHAHAPSTSPLNEIYSSPEVCHDFFYLKGRKADRPMFYTRRGMWSWEHHVGLKTPGAPPLFPRMIRGMYRRLFLFTILDPMHFGCLLVCTISGSVRPSQGL